MPYRVVTSRVVNGEIESHEYTVSTVQMTGPDSVESTAHEGWHVAVWQGKKLLQYREPR